MFVAPVIFVVAGFVLGGCSSTPIAPGDPTEAPSQEETRDLGVTDSVG